MWCGGEITNKRINIRYTSDFISNKNMVDFIKMRQQHSNFFQIYLDSKVIITFPK